MDDLQNTNAFCGVGQEQPMVANHTKSINHHLYEEQMREREEEASERELISLNNDKFQDYISAA